MMFEFAEDHEELARIRVVGVGGAGGNAVNRMIEAGLKGVEFIAVNTDLQALRQSRAHQVIQIGCQITRGLGSGGDPRVGRKAVEEDEATLTDALHGADMVFVTAGMGGGTGTGAAPVVARIARELGALTVAVVTKPFLFEGQVRMRQAEEGAEELRSNVDTMIMIPNQRLLEVVPPTTTMRDAFRIADNVLYEATRGIYEIISRPNLVNLDFADVRSVMKGMGVALMGTGRATGENRAEDAARAAISSPLLENVDIRGARAVLVNLTGADLGLAEVSRAMSLVQDAAGAQAHIIFGYGIDENLGDALQVTVVATGYDAAGRPVRESAAEPAREAFLSRPAAAVAAPAASFVAPAAAPAPRAEPVRVEPPVAPAAPWFPEPEPQPVRERRAFAAAAGGEPLTVPAAAAPPPASLSAFLTPVEPGVSPAAPAREPEAPTAPVPVRPAAPARATPFMSDSLLADLSEPAYTRKYLD